MFFILISFSGFTQEKKSFEVAFLSGANIGWWTHNKGKDTNNNYIGWDRSHTSAKIPFEFRFWWNISPKWALGTAFDYSIFTDDYLVDSEYQVGNRKTTSFSDKEYITIWAVKIHGCYSIINNKRFKLGPNIGVGYGNTNSTHPDQDRFKKNFAFSGAVSFQWKFHNKASFIFEPNYEALYIFPDQRNSGEYHRLSFFGIKIGLSCNF